jgi:integrase
MGEAVNDELMDTNPCDSIRPGKDIPKIPTREPNVLDAEQIALLNSFLDAAKPTPTNLGVRLALHTGMREGEICGLKWRNVDLESGAIKVRTVIGRDGGKTYVKEPKTERSKRDIPVSDSIIEALGNRRAEMARQCQEAAIAFSNDLYVLGRVDGSNLAPHALWQAWKAIAASLGLMGTQGRVPTFHDLRHTYATVAVDNGADPESVAHLLGHSKASMTLDVYATADKDAKILAAKKTSEALERKPKDARIIQLKTGTDGR